MNWLKLSLERIFDWAQMYGWSIPTFGFGMLFAMFLVVSSDRLQAFAAVGTVGAAFAAFWTIVNTAGVQRRRNKQEDESRKPSLRLVKVDRFPTVNPPTYMFQFVNLSQQAIYISEVYMVGPDAIEIIQPRFMDHVDLIVPRYGLAFYDSLDLVDTFHIKTVGSYEIFFYFNYALSGPLFYRLKLPIQVRKVQQESPKLKALVFEMRTQEVEGPLEPPPGIKATHMYVRDDE